MNASNVYSAVRRVTAIALLLGSLLAPDALAQSRGDGTIYSRFGMGTLETFSSSQIEALGGGATALQSLNYVNLRNPASWADQVLTRSVAGAQFQRIRATDDINTNPSELTAGGLSAAQISFPILKRKLGVAFALKPYARANYRVLVDDQQLTAPSSGDTAHYEVNFEGRGGLQQVMGGLGYRVNDYLDVGVSAQVLFGTYEDARRITFLTGGYQNTNLTTGTRLLGVTGTLGALYHQDALLRESDQLDLGAAFTLPTALSGEQSLTVGESLNRDTLDFRNGEVRDVQVTLPLSARLGASYQLDARWLFVADALYEPWSGFDDSFDDGVSLRPGLAQGYSDRARISAGVEVVPAGSDRQASYLARTYYRLGAYYDRAHAHPEGQPLRTLAATAGLSLPTLLSGTRIDLNLELGTRGTTANDLVRDRFIGVGAVVNFGEEWFRERKLQ